MIRYGHQLYVDNHQYLWDFQDIYTELQGFSKSETLEF